MLQVKDITITYLGTSIFFSAYTHITFHQLGFTLQYYFATYIFHFIIQCNMFSYY